MIITAKFKGREGSLGFKSGEKYDLHFRTQDDRNYPFLGHIVIRSIGTKNTGAVCPYKTLKGFLQNWDLI